jgi:hypothetical protein
MAESALPDRIGELVRAPRVDAFETAALAVFRFQYERIAAYRGLCDRRGATPESVGDWRQVPMVPASAFKSLELAAAPARETFRSSGTTAEARSVHHHPYPALYRAVIEATFPGALLPGLSAPPMLSLVAERARLPDSSLAFMLAHVLERFGGEGSAVAWGSQGVDAKRARSWLGARQRQGRPVVLLSTALALDALLAALERLDLRFRLPAGSRLFETGGFKGRERAVSREALLSRAWDRLAIGAGQVVREYGMTELTSHFYTAALSGGDPDLFLPPPWTRVRILDPQSLEEAAPGSRGLVAVFDLANLGSAAHLLTEDLGIAEAGGFRLAGRAAGAELRGCSLLAEELG